MWISRRSYFCFLGGVIGPVLENERLLVLFAMATCLVPDILWILLGKTSVVGNLAARVATALESAYCHSLLRHWCIIALLYLGYSVSMFILTYFIRWFHFYVPITLFDIFPPTFWSRELIDESSLPFPVLPSVRTVSQPKPEIISYGYFWNTWTVPEYSSTMHYYSPHCSRIF